MLILGVEPKPLRSLSASKMEAFHVCPAKFFYEYQLAMPKQPVHPATVLGKILHHICEKLLIKMMKQGPLPLDEKDSAVKAWTGYTWAVFKGVDVLPNQEPDSIAWLKPGDLEILGPDKALKQINAQMAGYIKRASMVIEAFYYLCSRGTTAVSLGTEKRCSLSVPSTVQPGVNVPINGVIDLLATFADGRRIIYDWKTGKRSELHKKVSDKTQMVVYSQAVFEETGVVPEAYLVSLDVRSTDFLNKEESALQTMLMKDPFLLEIKFDYEKEIEQLRMRASEMWYVLQTLMHPPQTLIEERQAKEFRPKSLGGIEQKYERHLQEMRPVPNVGIQACDYCSGRQLCEKTNKADWDKFRNALMEDSLHAPVEGPEDTLPQAIISSIEEVKPGEQLSLFSEMPASRQTRKEAKHNDKYNWVAAGFTKFSPDDKQLKKIRQLTPRHWTGVLCPCVEGKWVWNELLPLYPEILDEEQKHKNEQKEAKASGKKPKSEKITPLRESRVLNEKLKECPVGSCPHRCIPKP